MKFMIGNLKITRLLLLIISELLLKNKMKCFYCYQVLNFSFISCKTRYLWKMKEFFYKIHYLFLGPFERARSRDDNGLC